LFVLRQAINDRRRPPVKKCGLPGWCSPWRYSASLAIRNDLNYDSDWQRDKRFLLAAYHAKRTNRIIDPGAIIKMINRHMNVIAVQNLQMSALDYQDVPGSSIREIGDDGWRIFENDGFRIKAGHSPDPIPPSESGDHSCFACIVVDRVSH